MVTAFTAADSSGLTIHVANTGAARALTISGIPLSITSLNAVYSDEMGGFRQLSPVAVVNGTVTLQLAGQSLLTLTTLTA
jgi:putative effector of murein hydrolase